MFNEQGFDVDLVEGNDASEGWTIEDDSQAEWAMRKIEEAQAEYERWKTYYADSLAKIKAKTDNTVNFMTVKLAEYFRTVPHKETKTQEKYALPSGELILKKAKTIWVHDDEALLPWLKDNGIADCIKVTEAVSWANLKKRLAQTPDGIIYDAATGSVCDAVKAVTTEPEFGISNLGQQKGGNE